MTKHCPYCAGGGVVRMDFVFGSIPDKIEIKRCPNCAFVKLRTNSPVEVEPYDF